MDAEKNGNEGRQEHCAKQAGGKEEESGGGGRVGVCGGGGAQGVALRGENAFRATGRR